MNKLSSESKRWKYCTRKFIISRAKNILQSSPTYNIQHTTYNIQMILGLGGFSPFSFPFLRNSSNDIDNHGFPLAKVGPASAHLFFTSISSKGPFERRGCHSKKFNFFRRLDDVSLAACTSCFCFFDGNSSGKKTGKEVGSPEDSFIKKLFARGRWTNALLVANVLLYVAQMATQGKLMLWGAKVNSLIDEGQLWRLVTSSFLHGNIGHLLVNCYSLHSIGPTVENLSGTQRFFTIYFASAVTSSAVSYWLSEAPAVGASGAIFGLVGSIAVFSMRHRSLLGSGAQDLKQIAQVIALNMIIGLSSSGIDNWGHVGGLLGGAVVSWLIGPAWTYESTTKNGRKVFVDRAPISIFNQKQTKRFN